MVRHIVSGSPPTPNGDLHLGHLSGPYAAADIYTRARRLAGEEAMYIIGSDVNQSYVPFKAAELGVDAVAMAKEFDDEISHLFTAMDFSHDGYVRPGDSELHQQIVGEFFRTLYREGRLDTRTEDCLYCEPCARYLSDAHVTGTCPHCGNDDCDGNLCEMCARPNAVVDLVEPRCNRCGGPPGRREFTRLVFPLSAYAERLRDYHRQAVFSPQLEALCADLLARGLPDIPVTHPSDWGVPVPVEGFDDQRIFVWAEMLPGYFAEVAETLATRGEDPQDWRTVWNAAQVVQFFGWDNGYFHTLLYPALMMAYDSTLRAPHALLTNEFYLLDNDKFSTSRSHAVWGGALIAQVPADVVRFVLAHDRPQFERTNFTFGRFRELVDGELVGRWQAWLADLFHRLGDTVPDFAYATPSQRSFVGGLATLAADCLGAYTAEQFSPPRAARTLRELVTRVREFSAGGERAASTRPGSPEVLAGIAAEAQAAKLLAQLAFPIMPEFAGRLWSALGCAGPVRLDDLVPLPGGTPVGAPETAFFEPLPADLEQRVFG
jgi:methionyl-tRNA synthetase